MILHSQLVITGVITLITEDHWNSIPDDKKTQDGKCKYYLPEGNMNKVNLIPVSFY